MGVPGSLRLLSKAAGFGQNSRPIISSRLEDDKSQESLRGIRTDVHPAGDLPGCISLRQKLEGLGFARRQAEFLTDSREIKRRSVVPLEQQSQGWSRAVLQIGIQHET